MIYGVSACWKVNRSPPVGPCMCFWGGVLACAAGSAWTVRAIFEMASCYAQPYFVTSFSFGLFSNLDVVVFCRLCSFACLPSPVFGIITDSGPSGGKACARAFLVCSNCSIPAVPILMLSRGCLGRACWYFCGHMFAAAGHGGRLNVINQQ